MIIILDFHPIILQDHQGFRELLHHAPVLEMILPIPQPAVAHLDERNASRVGGDPEEISMKILIETIINETTRELSAALQAVEGLFHNLENEYRALEKMSRDLERQLADMRQSWSWKLTAPLRTAWRRPTP